MRQGILRTDRATSVRAVVCCLAIAAASTYQTSTAGEPATQSSSSKRALPLATLPWTEDAAISSQKSNTQGKSFVRSGAGLSTGSVPGGIITRERLQEVNQASAQLFVRAMATDSRGRLWIASDQGGLWCVDSDAPKGSQTTVIGDGSQIRFPMSLAIDHQNRVWVGTEGDGIWCFDESAPKSGQWHHFQVNDGMGDGCIYALTTDKLGRVWVGHLNHGVSVFNGEHWQNYNVVQSLPREGIADPDPHPALAGPLGGRVFCIATSPVDGDVWIGSDSGISRYSIQKDSWSYVTRSEGLPGFQIISIAFARDGTVYAATLCDGLATGTARNGLIKWTVTAATKESASDASGAGLPTNFINGLFVASDDTLYVATDRGLAFSTDHAKNFNFVRGADCLEKFKSSQRAQPESPREALVTSLKQFVAEDYVTAISQTSDGVNWIGYRKHLPQGIDPLSHLPIKEFEVPTTSFSLDVASLHPKITVKQEAWQSDALQTPAKPIAAMPSSAIPTLDDLNECLKKLSDVPVVTQPKAGIGIALPDDWNTRGAWLGRYGRYWACLAATISPSDFIWGAGAANVQYSACIGSNCEKGDSIRYWVDQNHTKDPRSLELPMPYLHSRVTKKLTTWEVDRRQSSWDDHGEAYPWSQQGPDVYCSVTIPSGIYTLSLYVVNNSQSPKMNDHMRDHAISLKYHPEKQALFDIRGFDSWPELAHQRIQNFWGGVYKRFLLTGPMVATIKVDRNHSFNTMLSGVFLDRLDENPAPYFLTSDEKLAATDRDRIEDNLTKEVTHGSRLVAAADILQAQKELNAALDNVFLRNPAWYESNSSRFYAMLARAALANPTIEAHSAATYYYRLNLFDQWERRQRGERILTSREIEKGLRWDGRSDGYPSYCFDLVTAYRSAHQTSHASPLLQPHGGD